MPRGWSVWWGGSYVWNATAKLTTLLCVWLATCCQDFNPYRLPYGTRFHVVTVANPKKT